MKIKGVAKQVVYIGDILKIIMDAETGEEINLKVFTSAQTSVKEGDTIYVTFAPEDVELLSK